MQIATDTELIEFNGWTLRVRKPENATRLLVMLHGWTGDENSMWVFTHGFPAQYCILAPRAPHPADPSGFSWRPSEAATFGRPTLPLLQPAAEALIQLVDAYAASAGIEADTFDVIGFSQGGAMTGVLGLLYPQQIRKMGVLAGFVPHGSDEMIAQKPLAGKNVFVAHGTQDTMVTIDRARESVDLLGRAGATVTYCEDNVGHKLSMNCLRALEEYLKD